jgi:putative hydrolase of HD superfamily
MSPGLPRYNDAAVCYLPDTCSLGGRQKKVKQPAGTIEIFNAARYKTRIIPRTHRTIKEPLPMKAIANLLFEARSLRTLPRSGYQFLGSGRESVAEHTFSITFIAYVMSRLVPEADGQKMMTMCLVHDLPEARIGDLNYVQKCYVQADESAAVQDLTDPLPFGDELKAAIAEFNQGESLEARLARDADQIAFILELKDLSDLGYVPPGTWIPSIRRRLQTDIGRRLAAAIMSTERDAWWRHKFIDRNDHNQ